MNCTICGKKITLVPSAAERAAKDVTGKSAAYYTKISRASFYRRGGFSNPRMVRVTRSGGWSYWELR